MLSPAPSFNSYGLFKSFLCALMFLSVAIFVAALLTKTNLLVYKEKYLIPLLPIPEKTHATQFPRIPLYATELYGATIGQIFTSETFIQRRYSTSVNKPIFFFRLNIYNKL